MGKMVVALILTSNLLICPFRCLSSDRGKAVDDGAARSTCSCCQQDNNCDDFPSKGDEPGNDCSCPNCICEGATLQNDSKLQSVDMQFTLPHGLGLSAVATKCQKESDPVRVTDRTPRFTGGRNARIAFQVWQI